MVIANSPAEVVRQLLVDIGAGSLPDGSQIDWQVFASSEPDVPDNCITCYDTTGIEDARIMVGGEVQHHFGFQVRVRSIDHRTGWVRANLVQDKLAKQVTRRSVTVTDAQTGVSGVYAVQCISKIGTILPLGKDAANSKRSLFTLNAMCAFTQTS